MIAAGGHTRGGHIPLSSEVVADRWLVRFGAVECFLQGLLDAGPWFIVSNKILMGNAHH